MLGERLGVGGMGIVYKAVYEENGKDVAVKVLSPGLSGNQQVAARFEREMAILKKLRHPNIVQYFGGGRVGGQQFFAMEYVPGGSVERLIKKKGKLSWEEALPILRQVAQALEYAHANGVIHRDLKPANLLFTSNGDRVKLGDFGIARDGDATALTAAGKTVGTYAYMAPEQISGKPPISRRTDLYALGCVAFELLTGRPPFVAETPAEMLFGHLNTEPPHVREYSIDCPMWLDEVITRLLSKDPEDRYYDALAVQVAFDEVKQKVEEQQSYVKQTLAGATTAANTLEGKALKDLVGGKIKKKKKTKSVPIYERAWFLALCLLLVIGGITWAMWPPSEAELYAEAAALMKSDDDADWFAAREDFLLPLIERFPDGKHVKEARSWLDKIELHQIEEQAENRVRRNQKPRNEAERLLMDAIQAEADDKIIAIGKYHTMIKLVAGDPKTEAFGRIARNRAARLESQIGGDEKVSLVKSACGVRSVSTHRAASARHVASGTGLSIPTATRTSWPRTCSSRLLDWKAMSLRPSTSVRMIRAKKRQGTTSGNTRRDSRKLQDSMLLAPAPPTLQWIGGIDGVLRLLDQTRLPLEEVTIDCRTPEAVWEAIRSLRVRGAPAIGVAAAYGVVIGIQPAVESDRDQLDHVLQRVCDDLATSRPTAVNLFWAIERMRRVAGDALDFNPRKWPSDSCKKRKRSSVKIARCVPPSAGTVLI